MCLGNLHSKQSQWLSKISASCKETTIARIKVLFDEFRNGH